jgi:catechol 2,3-dioxygenase
VTPGPGRLPHDLRFGTVTLEVADLERSLAFYVDELGLAPLARAPARAALGPEGGATLLELVERPGARPVPPGGRVGLFHAAILLPDRASLGRFARHLHQRRRRAGAADHLVSEAFYLSDPDGLGVEVYADRPRATWATEGGALVMDTLPIDLESLVAEAGDTAWTGMPLGAAIGHVHLHVGDLARARACYVDALGFDVSVSSFPGALFAAAGSYHHHLGLNTWAADPTPATAGDARLLRWEIVVPGTAAVQAAASRLAEAGQGVEVAPGGAHLELVDPWGIRLRVRAERERAERERAERVRAGRERDEGAERPGVSP